MTDDPNTTPPPGGQPQALTDEEIEAIRHRAESATPGPWYVSEAHASCGEVWIHTQNPPPVEALIPPYNWDDAGPNFGEARWKAYYRENIDPSLISTGWDDNPINAAFVAHARTDVPALLAALDEARARASHFESLAMDQQATNAAMVASLQRGLAELKASEAECARLRDDCAALLKILDATYDGPLGRFTRDRIGEEIAAADRGRAPAGEARTGLHTPECPVDSACRTAVYGRFREPHEIVRQCWDPVWCRLCGADETHSRHQRADAPPAPAGKDEAGESKPRLYLFQSTCGICGTEIGGDGDVCGPCATDPVRRERFSALPPTPADQARREGHDDV
jgi:hypothetical protein